MKQTYAQLKKDVRNKAILWQNTFPQSSHSYCELAQASAYFESNARRYGLIKEFQENGII